MQNSKNKNFDSENLNQGEEIEKNKKSKGQIKSSEE